MFINKEISLLGESNFQLPVTEDRENSLSIKNKKKKNSGFSTFC